MEQNVDNNVDNLESLFQSLWNDVLTQVEKPRFEILNDIKKEIYEKNLEGDIVECGIWRGGVLIYLSHLFSDRVIWGLDSFEGFEKLEDSTYKYDGVERHVANFDELYNPNGMWTRGYKLATPYDEVVDNLKKYGLEISDRIKLLKGYVRETTEPKNCPIDKISLLRIDVDGYSPTLEVLINLYDKVVQGGYIVFDDIPLYECQDAIRDFKLIRGVDFELIGERDDYEFKSYFIKK